MARTSRLFKHTGIGRFVQHLGGQSFYISEEQFVEHFPWPYIYQFDQEGINKEYPWKVFNKNLEASKKT